MFPFGCCTARQFPSACTVEGSDALDWAVDDAAWQLPALDSTMALFDEEIVDQQRSIRNSDPEDTLDFERSKLKIRLFDW